MTGNIKFLIEVCDMAPASIKLPDGRFTISTKQGTFCLRSNLRLLNVFFVGDLQFHLISVSQLTCDSGCIFQLSDKLCVVQDCITHMLIGTGEQLNGLYLFRCGCNNGRDIGITTS